jgi:bifunctional DNase/RNase
MKDGEIDKREAERLKKQADDAKAATEKGIDPASVSAPLEREVKIRERSLGRWDATGGRDAAAPTEREVKIRGLMMDPVTNMPVVVLRAVQGAGTLPIWVGIYEANAIALEIEKVQTPRPMTHDLLKNVLMGLNVQVQKVVVSDLKDDTFYAVIWMEREGQTMSLDSRPSDALALALRLDCPIFVEEEVFKTSKISSTATEKTSNEELRRWLENLNDEDLGRYKM